jgi:hypothetical protein
MAFADLVAQMDRAAQKILGDAIRYETSFGGETVDVLGVFWPEYVRSDSGAQGVVRKGPAVALRLADLVRADGELIDVPEDHALITARGFQYRVRETELDGEGGVLLHLHAVEV